MRCCKGNSRLYKNRLRKVSRYQVSENQLRSTARMISENSSEDNRPTPCLSPPFSMKYPVFQEETATARPYPGRFQARRQGYPPKHPQAADFLLFCGRLTGLSGNVVRAIFLHVPACDSVFDLQLFDIPDAKIAVFYYFCRLYRLENI